MNKSYLKRLKTRVFIGEHGLSNVGTSFNPGERNLLHLKKFKKDFKLTIVSMTETTIEFEMINIDVSFANALRRVLLAEIPTLAFDKIMMYNNTSVIQDEILAHRIGLCPLKVDPRLFEYRTDVESEGTEDNTIQFKLHVKCKRVLKGGATEVKHDKVTTADLQWTPIGNQAAMFAGSEPRLVHLDPPIILSMLRPGQEIELVAEAMKGTGSDHAKFQPVATASFRPMPEIILLRRISGEAAKRLETCFSPGVIDVVLENGEEVARVVNSRLDMCSRNVFRYDDLKDAVEMNFIKDHFIFKVESTGILPPQTLVTEAIKILVGKAQHFRQELDDIDDDDEDS